MVDGVTRKLTAARECGVHAVPFVPRDIFALVMPLLALLVWCSSPSSVVGAARNLRRWSVFVCRQAEYLRPFRIKWQETTV